MTPIEMNKNLTKLLGDKLSRFCRPIVDMLDITHFYHYTLTRRGEIAAVGLHSGLQEYMVHQPEWATFVPYVYHNMDNLNGLVFTQALPSTDWKKSQDAAACEFDVHLGLQISNKTPYGIEGFGFGLKSSDPLHHMALLNHTSALQLFINEYKKNFDAQVLLENKVDVASMLGPDFFDASKVSTANLKKMLHGKMAVKTVSPLSDRETEVADLLLYGYSAAQIGDILFRSNRTIESHIERMKEKLGCSRKSELIQKLHELKSLGA